MGDMKRLSAFLLTLLLGGSMLPLSSCDEPEVSLSELSVDASIADLSPQETRFEEFSLFYDVDHKGYLVGDYKGSASEIILPNFATGEDGITAPVIGLADYAFYGRKGITAVVLNEAAAFIGKYAFADSDVTDLRVTASLRNIDDEAFENSSIAFYELDGISYLPSMDIKYFLAYCGGGSEKLGPLHPLCESIVFYGRGSLFLISVPKSAGHLKSVTIPSSRKLVYTSYSFVADNFYFMDVDIRTWLKDRKDVKLELSGHVHLLDKFGNEQTTVTSSDFGAMITIPEKAFNGCASLTSVEIGSAVETIGQEAFAGCYALTSLTVDPTNTNLYSPEGSNGVFEDAYKNPGKCYLVQGCASTVIPDNCRGIGSYAFAYCDLASLTIPSSVVAIGTRAFTGCRSLTFLSVPSTVTEISGNPFGCNSAAYHEKDDICYVGNEENPYLFLVAPKSKDLTEIKIAEGCRTVLGGTLSYLNNLESLEFPNSVKYIHSEAFMCDKNLKTITWGSGLIEIGYQAFRECSSLTEIMFPNSLKYVEDYAFSYCDSLKKATFQYNILVVRAHVFYECKSLGTVYCYAKRPAGWEWEPSRVWFNYKGW